MGRNPDTLPSSDSLLPQQQVLPSVHSVKSGLPLKRELKLWPLILSAASLSALFWGASYADPKDLLAVSSHYGALISETSEFFSSNETLPRGNVFSNRSSVVEYFPLNATESVSHIDVYLSRISNIMYLIELGSLFGLWYLFNVYFNIFNKQVLSVFPFPLTVTTIHFGLGGLATLAIWGVNLYPLPPYSHDLMVGVIPVAIFHSLGNLFTNWSVREVNVSFTHVVKSLEPFIAVAITFLIMHKTPTVLVVASLFPTVLGVSLASLSEISFNWTGFWSAMASNLTFQLRNVLSKQILTQDNGFDNINFFSVITLQAFIIVLPFALVVEFPNQDSKTLNTENDIRKVVTKIFPAAFCFHAYQQVSYMILQRVTPVTHSIGNCLKRMVVIVASVVFFRIPVSGTNAIGIGLAILGVFAYSQVKSLH